MKRTRLKKKSKQKISVIQRTLWELCRQVCLKQQADKNGEVHCYTCSQRNLVGSNRQLGHMWSKASLGAYLKYDIRVLRWQCFACNIHRGGAGADFYARMLSEIGEEQMAQLQKDRQVSVKAYDFYLKLISEYSKMI